MTVTISIGVCRMLTWNIIQHFQLKHVHGPLVQKWMSARHTLERTIFSYDLNNARVQHVHIQDQAEHNRIQQSLVEIEQRMARCAVACLCCH